MISSRYVDGDIDTKTTEKIEAHLGTCSQCSELISDIRDIIKLANSLGNMRMPDGVKQRLRNALAKKIKNKPEKANLRLVKSDNN